MAARKHAYDYDKATAPSKGSLERLRDIAKKTPGIETKSDKFGWRAKKANSNRIVWFCEPNSTEFKYNSIIAAQVAITPIDQLEFLKSHESNLLRMEAWDDWDILAAAGRVSAYLAALWASDPILREIKEQLDKLPPEEREAREHSKKKDRTHYAGLYKVTLQKPGVMGDGVSYHGQFVRDATRYKSHLAAARARWSEHIRDSISKETDAGFHYMLRLHPNLDDWKFELVAVCKQAEDSDEYQTEVLSGVGGLHGDDVHCGEPVVNFVGANWADKVESAAIDADGGHWGKTTDSLDNPTTFNLTSGGQGDPFARFSGMLVRSKLGFERFLEVYQDFLRTQKRQPKRTEAPYTYKGKSFNIGRQIHDIRVVGCYVKGYPSRVKELTRLGFIWSIYDEAAAAFMRYLADYAARTGGSSFTVPFGEKVEMEGGKKYPLGRNVHLMCKKGLYIFREPGVLSFAINLGFKSDLLYENWCTGLMEGKLISNIEAKKLRESEPSVA